MSQAKVKFWGVRGSVPAPITSEDIAEKVKRGIVTVPWTYGGNTSCVEVRYGDDIFIIDLGTGLRPLGNSLFPDMFRNGGLDITFILSHLHWDHIQGLPFFGPLYVNKGRGIKNSWHFYGGTTWQKTAEICLRGQMDPPTFPVSWEEINKITHSITFSYVHDLMLTETKSGVQVDFGKLNHPQETYGSRFIFPDGKVLAYTTDNEPYDPKIPDPRLLRLAKDADIWITDCQYMKAQYDGAEGGVPRHGWGHSYPEAVAETAVKAGVKKVLLFHHDPASKDDRILSAQHYTQSLISEMGSGTQVIAAYEGLELEL